jgi:hypothetical protein
MSTRTAFLLAAVVTAIPAPARGDGEGVPCCTIDDDRPPCATDSSDVVGYRRCTPYGAWGSNLRDPEVFMDLGMNVRHFAPRGGPVAIARASDSVMASGRGDEAWLFDERMGIHLNRALYLAFDFEFGDFAASESPSATQRVLVVDTTLAAGAHVGVGPLALRGEIAGGVMSSALANQTDMTTEGMVEARGRVDLWLSPWFTIGGVVGASLLHDGDWMAGLYFGFHTWSYAGER